jgi:hypothetical protein
VEERNCCDEEDIIEETGAAGERVVKNDGEKKLIKVETKRRRAWEKE